MILLWTFLIAFVVSLLLVRGVIAYLNRRNIMDMPNERSSHAAPVPRGGGLGVMPVIWAGMVYLLSKQNLGFPTIQCWQAILLGGVALALVSWIDDRSKNGLRARWRLGVQALAVAVPLILLPPEMQILPEYLSMNAERALLVLAWLWFINLYNFMDGINGITGVQTMSITGGLVAIGLLAGLPLELGMLQMSLWIAGACAGFLVWNLHRDARVFLGDTGSIGLGYVLGWLLITIALQGHLVIALILPMVYIADATVTLVKRASRGEKIWQAHRTHFYQQATRENGLTHLQAVTAIAVTNMVLVALAIMLALENITTNLALIIAGGLVITLLSVFHQIGRRANAA